MNLISAPDLLDYYIVCLLECFLVCQFHQLRSVKHSMFYFVHWPCIKNLKLDISTIKYNINKYHEFHAHLFLTLNLFTILVAFFSFLLCKLLLHNLINYRSLPF